jgi:predicted phosphodiesterase
VKRAILSDIHANLEALEAVMADVAKEAVDSVYCLGDIVGYGPTRASASTA